MPGPSVIAPLPPQAGLVAARGRVRPRRKAGSVSLRIGIALVALVISTAVAADWLTPYS